MKEQLKTTVKPPYPLMPTKIEIKEKIKEAKHMMFITRPLRGYLGNQYNYWESVYLNLKSKL